MQLIPAIDLLNGRCVRLLHGDFDRCKVYNASAADLAHAYASAGAKWLHVVDLAASRDGERADSSDLFRLLNETQQKVQTGGGVRGADDITQRLDNGADRVVIGSLCVTDPDFFKNCLQEFGPQKLVAALDVRLDSNGVPWPRIHGWTEGSDRTLWQQRRLDQAAPVFGIGHAHRRSRRQQPG